MNTPPIRNLVEKARQIDPGKLKQEFITYIDIASIDRETKQIARPQVVRVAEAPSRARQQVRAGDVLVATVRPNLNAVARVAPEYNGEIASTGYCILRPHRDALDSAYLFFFVQSEHFVSRLTRLAIGAGYPAVSDDDILDCTIPLPSLPEQQSIAALLKKTDHLRRKCRYATQLSQTFLQAVFVRMFGDALTESAPSTSLSDMVKITGGGTPRREIGRYYQGRIPWLTSKDMRGDYIVDTQEHITEEAVRKSATNLVPAGSVLIVVKSKILMHRLPLAIAQVPLCHGQDVKSIQCSEKINNLFALHLLKYNEPRLLNQARGVNTEGLTLPMLQEVRVPSVSVELQLEFARTVQRVERVRAQQREAQRQADHLFQTLLHRTFDGHEINDRPIQIELTSSTVLGLEDVAAGETDRRQVLPPRPNAVLRRRALADPLQ